MLRVVHTITTGSARVAADVSDLRPSRGSGSVLGSVFADWNGNGLPDAGEQPLPGIPVRLGFAARATTAHDGQFTFVNVPAGPQDVGLDLNALPVDFDPPVAPSVVIELSRGETRRVAFALVPLGGIRGRIVEDANRNGQVDANEAGIDGAISPSTRACDRSSRARAPFDSTPCALVSITSSC